ncbi:sulfite efflux pump SSU1 [Penicillium malachiteum]|uniref:Sulfite efflux pump SSU1 n=1 Tax=Penicillium malachiteum TaxID=1324776 RepID=A0AAD6MZF0_9EURO|nr:sulfite efflux pump SSU1 [Penicillium malachiteum]
MDIKQHSHPPQSMIRVGEEWFALLHHRPWFSVTMGTGIVSILLHNIPYNGIWLYWISLGIFALSVLPFGLGCIISILRYTLYPEIFKVMIMHPVQSMFLGIFSMGLAMIINMSVFWYQQGNHVAPQQNQQNGHQPMAPQQSQHNPAGTSGEDQSNLDPDIVTTGALDAAIDNNATTQEGNQE